MLKRIPYHTARNLITIISVAVILFHLLVLTGIIPYSIVWGGRLKSQEQMRTSEIVSLIINALLVALLWIKKSPRRGVQFTRIVMWLYVLLFALNTVGNLMAASIWEKVLFTPLTLLLAVLCARIATYKPY